MAEHFARRAEALVVDSMGGFRVVVLHGARQAGKTTMGRLLADRLGGEYVTFDRTGDLTAAIADPEVFLESLRPPIVIDEVQRAGDRIVLAVKATVDTDNRTGRFLLMGSTNFLTVPSVSETLAGRVDLVTLWPLAEAEISSGRGDFIERAFSHPDMLARYRGEAPSRSDYFTKICRGGYPEIQRLEPRYRRRWFARYADTVIQREIEAAADIRKGRSLKAMLRLLAAQTAQELVVADVARRLALDRATVETYEQWLETAFLVHRVPAWSRSPSRRVLHRPKTHLVDTGLAAALLGKDAQALQRPTDSTGGPLLETFVANELAKQLTWTATPASLHHYRESRGPEVDLIIERDDGTILGIEVKSTTSPREQDTRGLTALRRRLDTIGNDFTCGILLHTGTRRTTFGDRIHALPIADIWT
jgi:uncharacterized protein